MRAPFAAGLRATVHGKGRLPVGGGGNEAEAAIGRPNPAEEAADRLAAEIPIAPRRHGVDGVLAQKRDERIEIVALPGRWQSL